MMLGRVLTVTGLIIVLISVIYLSVVMAYDAGLHTCHVKVPYSCDIEQP